MSPEDEEAAKKLGHDNCCKIEIVVGPSGLLVEQTTVGNPTMGVKLVAFHTRVAIDAVMQAVIGKFGKGPIAMCHGDSIDEVLRKAQIEIDIKDAGNHRVG